MFDNVYVSINHGIFLCHNCAYIHQNHYGVEVSFIKSIIDNRTISDSSGGLQSQLSGQAANMDAG